MAAWLPEKGRIVAHHQARGGFADGRVSLSRSGRELSSLAVESLPFRINDELPVLNEPRRRAYLDAMQVVQWLPRAELPFAAPSRAELLAWEAPAKPEAHAPASLPPVVTKVATVLSPSPTERPRPELPRPATGAKPARSTESAPAPAPKASKPVVAAPRFALQLLRAGACLVLVELPTGEAFQSRDSGYLLLKDMLRAAGLPDSPRLIGEPVRWPLLARGSLDQGPEAARDFVQGFISVQLETEPCDCIWLVGLSALRYAADASESAFYRLVPIDNLCEGWALPGLETLMDEPMRKADVWHAMRPLMARWKPVE